MTRPRVVLLAYRRRMLSGDPMLRSRLARASSGLRRAVLRRRRLLAALFVGVAVAAGLRAYAAPPPPSVAVTVAARDLGAGTVLEPGDLTTLELDEEAVPAAALHDPVGETLAAPLSAGEPVTSVRVVGPGLTAGHDDLVATPVRLPDAGMVGLLRPGDRIDLLAADARGHDADLLGADVPVLAVPPADSAGPHGTTGRLVVLGLEHATALTVASAAVASMLTFTYSPG